jgi:hypothetical protein
MFVGVAISIAAGALSASQTHPAASDCSNIPF